MTFEPTHVDWLVGVAHAQLKICTVPTTLVLICGSDHQRYLTHNVLVTSELVMLHFLYALA